MPTQVPSVATFTAPGVVFPGDPRKSPTEAVVFWLRRDIVRGVFEPLERLKVEQLSEFYGVGHTPIREAINRLSATGLIVHEHQKGHRVAPVSVEDYNDTLLVYQRLRMLALDLAMERGDDAWEERVVVQLHRTMKVRPVPADQDPEVRELWQRAYGDLQGELVNGCGSPLLVRLFRNVGARAERYGLLFADLSTDLERDHAAESQRMVEALIARDAARVQALLDESGALARPVRDSVVAALKQRGESSRKARRAAKPSGEATRPRGRPRLADADKKASRK
ncbi:MAG: GntR family transcriptional regulator [Phenylobacterium sp.]|uniref:GntR family transcriptional regulator n=1 Tax=Phenylobacterium sp. TaxID=1871053 RepID=UPI002733D5B0|nr:GntR family transcriptional regulator [Phenylobacterium sp.]MDP3745724.1 GntR family transcriptional regulator [Phenylobacterium sp.]